MSSDLRYIEQRGARWRVKFPRGILAKRYLGSYDSLEEAIQKRDAVLRAQKAAPAPPSTVASVPSTISFPNVHAPSVIEGIVAPEQTDPETIWADALRRQEAVEKHLYRKKRQVVTLPDQPVAIALLSDLHLDDKYCDLEQAKKDAELIARTPGMRAIYYGDGLNNWVVGKLQALQRESPMPHPHALVLYESWIQMIGDKLEVVVSGNHDNWTYKTSGVDLVRSLLGSIPALYDPDQVVFELRHGDTQRTVLVRHDPGKFKSIFNQTHGQEVMWERGEIPFDWAMCGHIHTGTICRPFYRQQVKRYAFQTGTYKMFDRFGVSLGFPQSIERGCGAIVLWPTGEQFWTENLSVAAEFLDYSRSRFFRPKMSA